MTHPGAALGSHILADLDGVDGELLRDRNALESLLRQAALNAGSHVLGSHFHSFGDRGGVTGVVLLAESHISIHTWPEFEFAAIDIFMCGLPAPERALAMLIDALAPSRQHIKTAARGISATPIANVR